nr:GNAT family N-acetyltransferase [candidate division Zixibacteria bacterium]
MVFKLITDFDEFMTLRQPWNELLDNSDVNHAFMRHEWFECWIKNFLNNGRMSLQTAWMDGILMGVAPLYIIRRKRKGVPFKIKSFLRASISPRCNFILHDSIDPNPFFDSVLTIGNWDFMELMSVDPGQKTTRRFIEYLDSERNYVVEKGIQSPYEILNMNWEAFEKSRSKGNRKNFRNSVNRMKKSGEYTIIKLQNPQEFEKHHEDLLSISSRSWKTEGGTDLKTDFKMASFYRDLGQIGARAGFVTAYILVLNDIPIAFDYYLSHNHRLVGLRWEYDDEYRYQMPGVVLHAHVIRDILKDGHSWELDLAGMVTEAKTGLAKDIRGHVDITVGRPGLKGDLLMFFKKRLVGRRAISENIPVVEDL